MRTDQEEPVLLMQFRDRINQPIPGCVAAGTIIANGHAVHIGVAGTALIGSLIEDERCVARLAIHLCVSAYERIARQIMVERNAVRNARPIRRYMALGAIHFHGFAVRRLRVQPHSYQQEGPYLWQSMHWYFAILNDPNFSSPSAGFLWHSRQSTVLCSPSSGKAVLV